jgi:DNA primase large subunit
MDEDTRLEPILANLSQGFIAGMGSEWGTSENTGEGIRAEMVDELAHKHFPMCMRNLHDNLKRNHHLKHFGRLQYGLFLKVGSLSSEESKLQLLCTGSGSIYRRGPDFLAQVFQWSYG